MLFVFTGSRHSLFCRFMLFPYNNLLGKVLILNIFFSGIKPIFCDSKIIKNSFFWKSFTYSAVFSIKAAETACRNLAIWFADYKKKPNY
jgi:hypothetical protein